MIVPPAVGLASGARADPLCGSNSVFCYPSPGTIVSSDSVASCLDPSNSNASYDLIHGIFAVGFSFPHDGSTNQGGAAVSAVDQYRVEGASPGTPLVFSAELDASLAAYGFGCMRPGEPVKASSSARLTEGASNQSSASITTPVTCGTRYCCAQAVALHEILRVTVTRSAGEPFTLHFDLATNGHGSGQASGQLRFSGLPSGAFVVSCQGYGQDRVTAAKGTSWGRLKLLYR